MVDVYIDIEDALVESEEFKDTEDNVCRGEGGSAECRVSETDLLNATETTGTIQMGIAGVNGFTLTIYITKAASFALFGVMKTTGPIDGYVAFLSVEARGTLHTAACADATELE